MLERALETEAHVSPIILKLIIINYVSPIILNCEDCPGVDIYDSNELPYETNLSFKQLLKFHLLKVWHLILSNNIMMKKQMILLILRPHMEHTTGSTR